MMYRYQAGDIVRLHGETGLRVIDHYNGQGQPFVLGRVGGRHVDDAQIERALGKVERSDYAALPELLAAAKIVTHLLVENDPAE